MPSDFVFGDELDTMHTGRANQISRHPVFEAISTSVRRELLRFLLVRDDPVTEERFVGHLAGTDRYPMAEGAVAERQTIHTDLVHTQLPVLADAGLITWDRDATAVETAPHPAFDDPRFRLLLDAEADDLDAALSSLAIDQRRALLTILRDAQVSITQTDLAREFLRSDETEFEPDQNAVDDVLASLHHVHLPALGDAGLVEYDRKASRVAYTGHPAVEEIFTIIYEPDTCLADSYDGFFKGLKAGIDKLKQETDTEAEWPDAWRNSHHG